MAWLLVASMCILIHSCQWMSRILPRHHWSTVSIHCTSYIHLVNCPAFRSIKLSIIGSIKTRTNGLCSCSLSMASTSVGKLTATLPLLLLLPSRWTHHLKQPARQRDFCSISVDLASASENISLPGLVSRHYHQSPLQYSPTFSVS